MDDVRAFRTLRGMKVSAAATGLKRLRQQAKMSVGEVAAALDKPKSTYASYEDKFKKPYLPLELIHALVPIFGQQGVSKADILALGGILDGDSVSPAVAPVEPKLVLSDLGHAALTLPGVNLYEMPRDVPTYSGAIAGEDGLFEYNGEVVDYAKRPPRLMGVKDAYALFVIGDSMMRWRKPGGLVFVHPNLPVAPGDYVVVQLKQEREGGPIPAYIKQLVRRTARDVRLRQFNPEKEFSIAAKKVASIHRILDWEEIFG